MPTVIKKLLTRNPVRGTYSSTQDRVRVAATMVGFWNSGVVTLSLFVCSLVACAPSLALLSPATLYSINLELGFLHSVLGSDGVPDKRAVKTASQIIIPIPPLPERVLAVPFLMLFLSDAASIEFNYGEVVQLARFGLVFLELKRFLG